MNWILGVADCCSQCSCNLPHSLRGSPPVALLSLSSCLICVLTWQLDLSPAITVEAARVLPSVLHAVCPGHCLRLGKGCRGPKAVHLRSAPHCTHRQHDCQAGFGSHVEASTPSPAFLSVESQSTLENRSSCFCFHNWSPFLGLDIDHTAARESRHPDQSTENLCHILSSQEGPSAS